MNTAASWRGDTLRAILACAVGLALLNMLLTMAHVWPTIWVRPAAAISVELAVFVLVVAVASVWMPLATRRWRRAFTGILLLLVLGRYGEVMTAGLFGRPINLYWEARHIPRIAEMAYAAAGFWKFALLGVLALAALVLLGLIISRLLGLVAFGFIHRRVARGAGAVAAMMIALYAAGVPAFVPPVSGNLVRQAGLVWEGMTADAAPHASAALGAADVRRLGGRDVYVLFLESYGATVFEEPRHAAPLAPRYADLAGEVARAGWHVASAYVISPTFGGASWLSHATFLTGTSVSSPELYEAFIASGRETLVDRFRSGGYRTVALVPGIKQDWPQGDAMRFDRVYDAAALDYRGPKFGWWAIPDQYSLEQVHRREIAVGDRRPLFLFFPTITSHMPFTPTPPYQPDWARMTAKEPYDTAVLATALDRQEDWQQLSEAYVRTVRYDLDVLSGFLGRRAGHGSVVIAVGDHQPPAIVAGPGRSWAVPVHVFTRSEAEMRELESLGFRPGLVPARPPLGGMESLTGLLLRALGRPTL